MDSKASGAKDQSTAPGKTLAKIRGAKKKAGKKSAGVAAAKQTKKKKSAGYDYENSHYLSHSAQPGVYRFNARGEPIISVEKKSKGKKKPGAVAAGGVSLGSQQPKPLLKKISLDGEKKGQGTGNPTDQLPPGTLPPGVNPGNVKIAP